MFSSAIIGLFPTINELDHDLMETSRRRMRLFHVSLFREEQDGAQA
jgi:hypothetical protein